ncbi:hypothetical protein QP164_01555 [Sphingomonas sp. LR59]|uniref:hypothetical protein n=1 Tax=Sphingomonas sp. LR59 TaxID=3050232 RepID=UPI002FE1EE93
MESDERVGSVEVPACDGSDPLRAAGRVTTAFSAAAFSAAAGSAARGRDARRGAGVWLGRTIVGASGIGTAVLVCGAGFAKPSRPRTGAVCSVWATAGLADASIVMVASRAASAPRSVVIVENPLRALFAALWPGRLNVTGRQPALRRVAPW